MSSQSHTISASRARAAAENMCTTLAIFNDEAYNLASPEMKDHGMALRAVLAGHCKCGNPNPTQRFFSCGEHLSCQMCFDVKEKNVNRQGKCVVMGCNCEPIWPARPCNAFTKVQECAQKACETFSHALQAERHKDVTEGARLRAEALGRDPDDAASRNNKKRNRADMTEEEWAEERQRRLNNREKCAEKKQKLAEYDHLKQECAEAKAAAAWEKAYALQQEEGAKKTREIMQLMIDFMNKNGLNEQECMDYIEARLNAAQNEAQA